MATSQSNVPSGGKTATPIDYLAEATKMGGTAQPTQEAVAPEPKIDYLAEATKMGGTAQPATPQIDYLAEATKMGGTAETPAQPVATPTPTTPVDKTGFAPISLESQGLDAGSKASALRALVGDVHTTDPKVINTLYTQAEKNLESANAEGQKARS